jgi:uncharacterized membrane protein YedE/YeeE
MRPVISILAQFIIGLVFGLGLVIAGMSDPAKVLNFLDLAAIQTGGWDPSLAFVMAGGIGVAFFGFKLVLRRPKPVFDTAFHLPTATVIDARILVGPAIFGVGWGLAGLCPGPAFTALATGGTRAVIFVIAMIVGMGCARWLARRPTSLPLAALQN